MNKDKRCVVNFSSFGRENYIVGSERMVNSAINVGLDADILLCSPDLLQEDIKSLNNGNILYLKNRYPVSKEFGICPPHQSSPYAFKSYAIQEAIDMGYTTVMWADSSTVFLKNPEHYFELASELGVVVLDNPGCPESTWTSDDCLEHMGCSIETARNFWQVDAFVMIFNFSFEKAKNIFGFYFYHSRDGICCAGKSGSIRTDFKDHRHDQSILSYACKKFDLSHVNYGSWSYFNDITSGEFRPTFGKIGASVEYAYILQAINSLQRDQ